MPEQPPPQQFQNPLYRLLQRIRRNEEHFPTREESPRDYFITTPQFGQIRIEKPLICQVLVHIDGHKAPYIFGGSTECDIPPRHLKNPQELKSIPHPINDRIREETPVLDSPWIYQPNNEFPPIIQDLRT